MVNENDDATRAKSDLKRISDALIAKVGAAAYTSWALKQNTPHVSWESLPTFERITWEIVARSAINQISAPHVVCECGRKLEIVEDYMPLQISMKRCAGCRGAFSETATKAGMVKVYDCTLGRYVFKKRGQLQGKGKRKK